MNIAKLNKYIDLYKKQFIGTAYNESDDISERKKRIEFYQSFSREKLSNISYEDFTSFIGTLWASSMYGNKKYLVDRIIATNKNDLKFIGKNLAHFIYGKESVDERWDAFRKEVSMLGSSYLSEMLSYFYPNDYAIANSQVVKALDILEVPNMTRIRDQMNGKKYLEICSHVKSISEVMKSNGLTVENLLSVDYLLWDIAKNKEILAEEFAKKILDKPITKSLHTEIIDMIVDIGSCLGFESEKEVKVATGAVVDAIWKVRIGNMGMIMYVFEVQSKGAIDSLVLNLQKASYNQAVQRLIAVSDSKQLQKIKKEVAPLKNFDLVLWDFDDVRSVHESLSNAFESINKLGLVPPDFK